MGDMRNGEQKRKILPFYFEALTTKMKLTERPALRMYQSRSRSGRLKMSFSYPGVDMPVVFWLMPTVKKAGTVRKVIADFRQHRKARALR